MPAEKEILDQVETLLKSQLDEVQKNFKQDVDAQIWVGKKINYLAQSVSGWLLKFFKTTDNKVLKKHKQEIVNAVVGQTVTVAKKKFLRETKYKKQKEHRELKKETRAGGKRCLAR